MLYVLVRKQERIVVVAARTEGRFGERAVGGVEGTCAVRISDLAQNITTMLNTAEFPARTHEHNAFSGRGF